MVKHALLMTTVIFMALIFLLMGECRFLIPYQQLLWAKYGLSIVAFSIALFINLFAGLYAIGRKVFLKDTGRKLAHLEKQLRTGTGLSNEFRRRLLE